MNNKLLFTVFFSLLLVSTVSSQVFSLRDTTVIFKNQDGKVLTKDEVNEFMKGVFSVKQENLEGRKVITIIPLNSDEKKRQQDKLDAFKNSLLNKPLPSFKFTDITGRKWESEKLNGRIVIFNFWFTACKPCILEMPHLNRLVADNKDSIVFIAPAPENEPQIKKFLKRYSFDYPIIPSSLDYITLLKIESFPVHLVVDRQGVIRQVFIGYADDIKEKLQAEIDKLKVDNK